MDRFKYLFNQYINKTASPIERLEFQELLQNEQYDSYFRDLLEHYFAEFHPEDYNLPLRNSNDLLQDVLANTEGEVIIPFQPAIRRLWPRIAAAASILMFLSIGSYFVFQRKAVTNSVYANDVAPGTGKPYITLASGQKIVLNSHNGILAQQGNVMIRQDKSGKVIYTAATRQVTDAPYNTLTNPRGGKVVSLILPDGTLTKLEAGSSITYQTTFTGKTRNISTTGKVYFEVAHNTKQPFLVSTSGQVTKDIGTQFIVEAFDDEPATKTTLIEGSVSVSKNGQKVFLKPGQQSTTNLNIRQADIDHETAWINGDFDFTNQDLRSIMRELARVYNIEVSYQGEVENIVPNGEISRSHNISTVLQLFEATKNVHFEINGRRVMVIAGQR